MKIINDRYEVIELLARENSFVEYLVSDKHKNRQVKRIRIFDTEMSNHDFIKLMEEHFVELKTVVHENVLAVYEFQAIMTVNSNRVNRKQFFYTYEHFDPSCVVSYTELNKSEINHVIVQLCKAVRFLHFRGIVYKYLNFDHLIIMRVNGKMVVKLKDIANNLINDYYFKMDHERYAQFIAPEIIWGEDTSYQADIYSLGAMVYYLYYRIDFQLKTLQNLASTGYLNEIHRFILKSTSHIKDERYDSVRQFIDSLSQLIWIDVNNSDIKYYDKIHESSKIIGREPIIKEIKKLMELRSRKALAQQAAFIQGENGSGKTRILNEIVYMCRFNRYFYLYLKPSDYSDSLYTIRALVKFIASQEDVSPILIQKYGQELVHLVPELVVKWNLKETKEIDGEYQILRLLNRVFNFFVEYTSNHFFVFLVDDFEKLSHEEAIFFELMLSYKAIGNYYLIATTNNVDWINKKYAEVIKLFKVPSLNLEETGLIVKSALGLAEIPYKLTHRLMLENQGKASVTKRMLKKLWYDGVIFFDEKTMLWNLDEVDDNYIFEYIDQRQEDLDHVVNSIEKPYYEILRKISILKGSFSMQTLFSIAEISEEIGYYFLYEMEEKRILNKRISDVEYVFVFNTNELRKLFYNTLSAEEVIQLSFKAARYYEQRFSQFGEIHESLIDYLSACGESNKAAQFCRDFADFYLEKANTVKAIELLEQSLDLELKLNRTEWIKKTAILLIRQLIKAGRLDRAHDYVNDMNKRLPEEAKQARIDVMIEHAQILYYKNDIQAAEDFASNAIQLSQTCEYGDGEFRAATMKCKCLVSKGDLEGHWNLLNHYLALSKVAGDLYHMAIFENERGVNYLYKNQFNLSIEAFTESLNYYKELDDDENIVRAYNNFGVIYLDGYGDYITARDFFRKAYTRASNRNYSVSLPIYLNNLGETYRIEGRYEMANKYFEESHQLAESIGDKNMTILALLNLCHGQMLNEKYGKAHKLITRLEHEVQLIRKRDYDKFDYYLLHFEFYLTMNSLMKVNQWRYEFDADEVTDEYRKFRLKMIDLRLAYKKNSVVLNRKDERDTDRKLPMEELEILFEITENPAEAKLLREFVLELLIDVVVDQDYLNAERLLQMDDDLMRHYNTKLVRLKRDFIEACYSDYVIERINNLVDSIKEQSAEFLWRVYYILGNAYYEKHNIYEALRSYLMALDVIADLASSIPLEYKETYILHDDVKMALKNKINKIIRILLNFEGTRFSIYTEGRIDTVEDFFDLSQFNLLYNNSEFLNLVNRNFDQAKENAFENATDLIKHLEKDEITNLKLILNYLQQLTIGERASIYLLDENDNISEIIYGNDQVAPYDLLKLVNSIGNDIEGIYVSKLDPHTNTQLLQGEQKGIICFPVYETSMASKSGNKRRDDLFSAKKKISGYVFLDTTNVINRFNESTFEHAKSFINLIYVFIDNYNLKKLSTVDKLTSVFLRKHIEQQFAIQMSISRQQNFNLSVIMLDIDKFKTVNDTYGHRKGDEILSKIGELLNRSVRSSDYVGRYGGEEFIILLPETDASSAYKVAEKIREIVQKNQLLGEDHPLTVSLGVSTYPEDGANEEELIEKADQALYYSKNNGRNRSTSWDDNLIKEGHRYDRLTGILTGNMSSDTRNMQAILDIINQLNSPSSRSERIKNTFISLLDITEGEEIQFVRFDEAGKVVESLLKQKGQDQVLMSLTLNQHLLEQYLKGNASHYFIDWDELNDGSDVLDTKLMPDWKSYILLGFEKQGLLAISVKISEKEFDFSNFNFVDSLKPVLGHLFFDL